ncbi:hypothetical protein J0692_26040, partial [Vibrio alginolyticus]|nr:hypothetical protein [Vibrio alginolyticus]
NLTHDTLNPNTINQKLWIKQIKSYIDMTQKISYCGFSVSEWISPLHGRYLRFTEYLEKQVKKEEEEDERVSTETR